MIRFGTFLTGLLLALSMQAQELRLPKVFGNNMVLQRGLALPVWGWAPAGAAITVSVAGQSVSVETPMEGRWQLKLAPLKASAEATEFVVTAGKARIELTNVLVGDVWLCSGQSNMEWRVSQSNNPKEEIAAANFPNML